MDSEAAWPRQTPHSSRNSCPIARLLVRSDDGRATNAVALLRRTERDAPRRREDVIEDQARADVPETLTELDMDEDRRRACIAGQRLGEPSPELKEPLVEGIAADE